MITRIFWTAMRKASITINVRTGGLERQTLCARHWSLMLEGRTNGVRHLDAVFGAGHCHEQWLSWIEDEARRASGT